MHALVTGGGGFLGRYIVEQLVAQGDRVRSLGRGTYPELEALGVEVQRGDVADRTAVLKACQGIDCVFHVAAIAGIGVDWHPFERINVRGTEHVLQACREHGVQRLVYTSSPSVVFAGKDQCGVDESAPYDFSWMKANAAHYSMSKALAERAVLAANSGELRTCAIRPHLIWGPRDNHLVPRLIERARSGRLRRVGAGDNDIDITYVANAADAHLQAADALVAADSAVAGKAYFISQGKPVNCWHWIDQVLALVNLPPGRKSISRKAATRVGAVCEWLFRMLPRGATTARLSSPKSSRGFMEPPMTRFLAAQLATSHWFDISAARRDFGYEPAVSTSEGMKRLGVWLRSHGNPRSLTGG
jgi:2-alkyl-3-oxoalkanoate reductase